MDTLEAVQHALDGGLDQGDDIQQAMQISLAGGGLQKVTSLATLALIGHTIDAALDIDKGAQDCNPPARHRRGRKRHEVHLVSSNVTGW
eukprot:5000105-Amphidinium_carterae.1